MFLLHVFDKQVKRTALQKLVANLSSKLLIRVSSLRILAKQPFSVFFVRFFHLLVFGEVDLFGGLQQQLVEVHVSMISNK